MVSDFSVGIEPRNQPLSWFSDTVCNIFNVQVLYLCISGPIGL